MIKNIKWLSLVALTVVACNNDDEVVADQPVTAGSADFSKYVALGDSFAAGYADGALFIKGQENSYPNLLASQFAQVGGGAFVQPLMSDNIGGFSNAGTQILPTFPKRLVVAGFNPDGTPNIQMVPGNTTTQFGAPVSSPSTVTNLGIPGAKCIHLNVSGYATANPYFGRFSVNPATSVLAQANSLNPTFFSLWIGGNDVLGYATGGGVSTSESASTGNDITPTAVFDVKYNELIDQLTTGGKKGVVANLPYVNTLPFFTTVPVNPLTPSVLGSGNTAVGNATIDALNAQLYGPLNQALTAFGAGDRIQLLKKVDAQGNPYKNPLLIKDNSLTNLSAQLTAALTPAVGAVMAGQLGLIFGQARQTKVGEDFALLTTKSLIGAAPTASNSGIGVAPSAPLNKFGITYPLQDAHILAKNEADEIKAATDSYNVTIKAAATSKGLAFMDAVAVMNQLQTGIRYGNFTMNAGFVSGGAFSLDGVHPTAKGQALIANKFLEAINAQYGSTFKMLDLATFPFHYPASL